MFNRIRDVQWMFNNEPGGGAVTPPPAPVQVPQLPPDVMQGLQNLISRAGGSDATNVLLYNETYELRKKVGDLESKVPKQGNVVLTKEEADALAAYRAYGDPDEVKKIRDERDTFLTEKQKWEREKLIAKAAEAVKWKAEVLSDLDTLEGTLDIQMKPIQRGSATVEVPYVTATDAQGAKVEKTLEDYVTDKRSAYLPALRVDANTPPRGGNVPDPRPATTQSNEVGPRPPVYSL